MRFLNKKHWPYSITLPKHPDRRYVGEIDPREQWCFTNLDMHNWRCFGFAEVTYAFKRQEDAVLFSLCFV